MNKLDKRQGNMSQATISVIIPAYNREDFIEKAVESVLRQTFRDWELILVDDGSEDRTGQICDRQASTDPRIRSIHIAHSGVSEARNAGMRMAKGTWTVFLDSDDVYSPTAFEEMLANAEGMDLVTASYSYMNGTAEVPVLPEKRVYTSFSDTFQDLEEVYRIGFYHQVWGKLYRTSRIRNTFEPGLHSGEDFLFNSTILPKLRNICILPSVVYGYNYRKNVSYGQKIDMTHLMTERRILETWKGFLLPEHERQLAFVFQHYIGFILVFLFKLNQIQAVPIQIVKDLAKAHLDTVIVDEQEYGYRYLPENTKRSWQLIREKDIDAIFDLFKEQENAT